MGILKYIVFSCTCANSNLGSEILNVTELCYYPMQQSERKTVL